MPSYATDPQAESPDGRAASGPTYKLAVTIDGVAKPKSRGSHCARRESTPGSRRPATDLRAPAAPVQMLRAKPRHALRRYARGNVRRLPDLRQRTDRRRLAAGLAGEHRSGVGVPGPEVAARRPRLFLEADPPRPSRGRALEPQRPDPELGDARLGPPVGPGRRRSVMPGVGRH